MTVGNDRRHALIPEQEQGRMTGAIPAVANLEARHKSGSEDGGGHFPHLVQSGEDGLALTDSILSLDAFDSGLLSFISSSMLEYHHQFIKPQIITTEETFRLLGLAGRSSSPLICQYNRPFSIGHLRMELLPTGTVLGGASLHLENQSGRLLYAPALQAFNTQVVRRMQVKRAETLVLNAATPIDKRLTASRNKEREKLVHLVQENLRLDRSPVIVAETCSIGPEVAKLLHDHGLPFAVHPAIHRVIQANRELVIDDRHMSRYTRRSRFVGARGGSAGRRRGAVIVPEKLAMRFLMLENQARSRTVIWVRSHAGDQEILKNDREEARPDQEFHVRLNRVSELNDLKEVIKAVAPKAVFFFGPYAKRYAEETKDLAAAVVPLFANQQPTLF